MGISKHISYKEGVYSGTATHIKINNKQDDSQMQNMLLVAEEVIEDIR